MAARSAEILVEGRYFCEGPRWHDGRFWFSDFYAHEVCSVGLDGDVRVEVSVPGGERPSGLGWLPDGRLLVVAMLQRAVLRREADGSLVRHADLGGVATFHANDMIVMPGGDAYVGNFGFDLDQAVESLGAEALLGAIAADPGTYGADLAHVAPDGTVSVAASGLRFPNGMVRLGGTLVVAESLGSELAGFDIGPDGELANRRTWASLIGSDDGVIVPDGIDADDEGGVWVANASGAEVVRVVEGGAITDRVVTSQPTFACAVGGPAGRHLLACTAADSNSAAAAAVPTGRLELAVI
ncbi:MAG: SMP-30/gluconolactonase/LRE family protein [Desertimonas sp.]